MPLTISREPEQTVLIGDDIEVKVTRVDGERVHLRITAPDNVKILRSELANRPPSPRDGYISGSSRMRVRGSQS
jgi:carbon storage regulator CsrA